jgi:hypothetical protein
VGVPESAPEEDEAEESTNGRSYAKSVALVELPSLQTSKNIPSTHSGV